MIKHIVLFTLKDPANAPKVKALLDSCKDIVPGIREFEVGIKTEGLEATADVVLVSGPMTGQPAETADLKLVKDALPDTPVFANTGVNIDNVADVLKLADGCVIGSHLKVGGDTWKNVDKARVKRFMDKVRKIR